MVVQQKLEYLHKFFTKDEVSAIIVNSNEIREVLRGAGLIEGGS